MAKITKKQKFKKIMNMVRRHGELVVVFQDNYEQLRRSKIRANGTCYVSYFASGDYKWTSYETSCFILDIRSKSLKDTINKMSTHDRGIVYPIEMIVNKKKVIK